MRKRTTKKAEKPLIADKGADFIWAALSILSLPTVALSLSSMNWHPLVAFFTGIAATLAVIFIEALVRGKLWIFQEHHRSVFNHQDTAFRILIVSGGVLLFIQTFLILQVIENPGLDHILLNLVIQKQCKDKIGPLTPVLCPLFQEQQMQKPQDFALQYSLEQAAKTKLLPQAVGGACAVKILNSRQIQTNEVDVQFLAQCAPWLMNGKTDLSKAQTTLINAEFLKNSDNYYKPLLWSQDTASQAYQSLIQDKSLIHDLNIQLLR